MQKVKTQDGTEIFFKDWGSGRPVVFSHGWPLNSDAWDAQMLFLAGEGYRVIAHDRRGHGRSDQPWSGNEMETYADDLQAVLDALDVRDATLVGHSTGGGEVVRYAGRHGTGRVKSMVLIGAVTPIMMKSRNNPAGLPLEVFDEIRANVVADRSQFFLDLPTKFFGFNRADATPSEGLRRAFWRMGMQASIKAVYDCIRAFSETDFTEDLRGIDVPMLILHGDDDQIVPVDSSARMTAEIVKGATLKLYPGLSHGMCTVNAALINRDLLAFLGS